MPKAKPSVSSALKKSGAKIPEKPKPLWAGPCDPGPNGGVTQSLLSRFIVCRERFRVKVIEGLSPIPSFQHRMEYGNLWHTCEEHSVAEENEIEPGPTGHTWEEALRIYAQGLCKKYPIQQKEVVHWENVCRIQFPVYQDYWSKHPDMLNRTPLLQEEVFNVSYELPSGRTVWLRGKFDSVDLVQSKKDKGSNGIWLQENKTKGEINEQAILRQITFDLQTMFYQTALKEYDLAALQNPTLDKYVSKHGAGDIFRGVRYNVIRRPLAGGKGSIRKHQPTKSNPAGESDAAFYSRLAGIIQESPSDFFYRWNVVITRSDTERFKQQFLIPCLEQLCDWWEVMMNLPSCVKSFSRSHQHYRMPYGVYNPMLEGGFSEVDEYLMTGSMVGLRRAETLFPELAEPERQAV